MSVVATILPAPERLPTPRVTLMVDARGEAVVHIGMSARSPRTRAPLLQFSRVGEDDRHGASVAGASAPGAGLTIRLPLDSLAARLHVQRVVLAAGT